MQCLAVLIAWLALQAPAARGQHSKAKGDDYTDRRRATEHMSVAELIEQLAHVKSAPVFMPSSDPIEDALVERGEPAVEPLLDCFVHDDRLTEALIPDFMHGIEPPSPWPVSNEAYIALERICHHRFTWAISPPGDFFYFKLGTRAPLAAKIQEYWQQNKGIPVRERCYATLKDDRAGGAEWIEAARYIARSGDSFSPFDDPADHQQANASPDDMLGEPLRTRTNPSVGELLEQRINNIVASPDEAWSCDPGTAIGLADPLLSWTGKDAAGTVRRLLNALIERGDSNHHPCAMAVIPLTLRLLALGDPIIRDDYTRWVKQVDPELTFPFPLNWFQPLWQYPDLPLSQEAANYVFTDPRSAWSDSTRSSFEFRCLESLPQTPLLGLAGFRQWITAILADRSRAGRIGYWKTSGPRTELEHYSDGTPRKEDLRFSARSQTKPATVFRVCDYCVSCLSEVEGIPKIKLGWSERKRDAAVSACLEALRRNGDRYQYLAANPWSEFHSKYRLRLNPPAGPP